MIEIDKNTSCGTGRPEGELIVKLVCVQRIINYEVNESAYDHLLQKPG